MLYDSNSTHNYKFLFANLIRVKRSTLNTFKTQIFNESITDDDDDDANGWWWQNNTNVYWQAMFVYPCCRTARKNVSSNPNATNVHRSLQYIQLSYLISTLAPEGLMFMQGWAVLSSPPKGAASVEVGDPAACQTGKRKLHSVPMIKQQFSAVSV